MRTGNLDRADGALIELRLAWAADHRIAITGSAHVVQAGEQQRGGDAAPARCGLRAHRAEEAARGGVIAGKAEQGAGLGGDEAGDGAVAERGLRFAGPG